jgi:hypothetical protein
LKLVLLEGLPKYEGINEAKTLKQGLKLMMKAYDLRRTRVKKIKEHTAGNKQDFLNWLQKDTDFLHVSCHGSHDTGNTVLSITQGGTVTSEDIWRTEKTKITSLNIKAKVVFMNACETSCKDLREAFFKAGKKSLRYYIAPRVEVPFDEAFIVALLFYKKAFLDTKANQKQDRTFSALKYAFRLKDVKTNYWLYQNPWLE